MIHLRVPGVAWVAGCEQASQLRVVVVADALVAMVSNRRIRYSGSRAVPRPPRVSFWTQRRTWSTIWLPKRTT